MDKLVLNIPKLREAARQSSKALGETEEIGKSVSEACKRLASRGTWEGASASACRGNAEQWNRDFKAHEKTVSKMNDAMNKVLAQAEALNMHALGFAGIVGAPPGNGSRDILTYDPDGKAGAIQACGRIIKLTEQQLELVKKAEAELTGVSGFRLPELSVYRKMLSDRKRKLVSLRQAIIKYGKGAEEFEATAARLFGSIMASESALATLKSWGIANEVLAGMLKGLNLQTNIYGGDPVNMATGNFVYEKEYLIIKGLFPLSFKMFYNSQEKRIGALGPGWTHNFGARLIKGSWGITLLLEDGREEIFFPGESGAYTHSFNGQDRLKKTAKGFVYAKADGLTYRFDEDGRNTRISDRNGNRASLVYKQGRLARVENNSGGYLAYGHSPDGYIVQVSDHTGRTVLLSYEDGKVSAVTGEEEQVQKYLYNAAGILSEIVSPCGVRMLAINFDTRNRVTKQNFPGGSAMQLAYNDEDKEIHLTEQNGNKVIYVHDDKMRSTAAIYSDGEERFAYNEQNRRIWRIDKNGNETRYGYDDKGNLCRVTNALGETVTVVYGKHNKPVKMAINGIERMAGEYDGKGNLICVRDALNRKKELAYNVNGQPLRITQPDGSVTELAYDKRGNIIGITDADSSVTKYEYDDNNRIVAATDPNGNRTCFCYNRRDEMTRVINAEGKERAYEYNKTGKLTRVTDFDGGVSIYEYNESNKPARFIDPGGQETLMEYDLMQNVTKQVSANGAVTRFDYDDLQRLIRVTNALGHCVKYGYDPNGNRTCITGPQGGQAHLAYDALNRVTEVTEADGAKSGFIYNELGQVTSLTDAMGNVRTYTYDAAGQKTEETDTMGNKTVFTYTPLGKVSAITDPAGRVTTFEYAPGGLLTRAVYPDGRWVGYGYDASKNLTKKQDQSGYALNYTYDSLNRVVKISSNYGQEKRYAYDAMGNVTSMTDANGNVTSYAYSPTGRLIKVVDAMGNETRYGYDNMGELTYIDQFGGISEELAEARTINESSNQIRAATYQRNLLGQVECAQDALGQSETYSYDALGRVTGKTDKDNYLTQYAYGQNGQLEHIRYADGKSVIMSYDPLRRLNGIQDWLGLTTIEADPLGRAVKVSDHNGKEVRYKYGAGGERLETLYPDGGKASYSYDGALRLRQLTDGGITVDYAYDKNSRLSGKMFSNGMSTRYEYNEMGVLSALTHSDQEGVLDRYRYRYDLAGNKTGIDKFRRGMESDSGLFEYGYDGLGRLGEVKKDGELLRAYEYDAFGNRNRMAEGDNQTFFSFNTLNQLMRAESPGFVREYRYDARGNLTGELENGITKHIYGFGAMNRLEKATNAEGMASLYQYNGLGQRVGCQIAGGPGQARDIGYILDLTRQFHNLLQTDEGGRTRSYLWDFGAVAERGGEGGGCFYLNDELGSPLRFAGADGKLADSYAYDEFGNDLTGNQGVTQPFGYTGYRRDSLAGTYFAQAREYDPVIGRFTARDVVKGSVTDPWTFNEYTYCRNRPMVMYDLNGQWPEWLPDNGTAMNNLLTISAKVALIAVTVALDAVVGGATKYAGLIADRVGIAAKTLANGIDIAAKEVADRVTIAANEAADSVTNNINALKDAGAAALNLASSVKSAFYEDLGNFNWTNDTEQAVIDSHIFSIYKGQLTVKVPYLQVPASYGIMVLPTNAGDADIKHEWGHYRQLRELGWTTFNHGIAIPSLTNREAPFKLSPDPQEYYSQLHEAPADMFGGVGRTEGGRNRTEAAELAGQMYYNGLRIMSVFLRAPLADLALLPFILFSYKYDTSK